tara:strand:+ start:512 stop:967 length:456 start_codon:yes stop_codon:yes gene_type:complete
MKTALTTTLALLMLFTLTNAQDLQATKGSEFWNQLYDPPFQNPKEIPASNPLRKELFNQLRPKLEKIAKQPLLFKGKLKAYRNWAMFMGEGLDQNNNPVVYDEFESTSVLALWLRTTDGWKLVDYDGGSTDAYFVIWPEQFGTPVELIKSW